MPEISALVSRDPEAKREARKTKDSTMDRIWKYYHDKKRITELDADEERIRERIEKAWFLLCNHKGTKEATEALEKLFGIKRSVAYDDVRNAMMLFGDPRVDMKDAKRAIAETIIMRAAEKAWDLNDLEMHHKYMKLYSDINMLTAKDDDRMADALRKMRPVAVVFVAERSQLEQQAADLMKDVPAEDTDYEEVKDEESN
jgi:hypothetical protein